MYDIQIFSYYNNVYEESDLPHDDYAIVTKLLMDQGIETVYDCTFHLYLPEKKAFHNRMKYDFPAVAISLQDYNAIRCMLGLSEITGFSVQRSDICNVLRPKAVAGRGQ